MHRPTQPYIIQAIAKSQASVSFKGLDVFGVVVEAVVPIDNLKFFIYNMRQFINII
jgi:hypothetical protein